MKRLQYFSITCCMAVCVFITACNDQNSTTDSTGESLDTNRVDSRRNATDTVNYLTKDSSKQSQEVVDPNPPGESH